MHPFECYNDSRLKSDNFIQIHSKIMCVSRSQVMCLNENKLFKCSDLLQELHNNYSVSISFPLNVPYICFKCNHLPQKRAGTMQCCFCIQGTLHVLNASMTSRGFHISL